MPARSLRIIFSVSSPWSSILLASNDASDRLPALPRSLWQVEQYCLTTAVCSAGSIVVTAGACVATGFCGEAVAGPAAGLCGAAGLAVAAA